LEDRANKTSEALNPIQVFVGKIGSVPHDPLFQVSSWLWKRSITTVLQNQEMNFKEMLKYCLERNARYLLCVGENEFSRGAIIVKDLLNKEQVEVPLDEEKIMALLKFS
jgi:histidyl-tRNA synthetase